MKYISLLAILLFGYPFALEYLRTGKINKQQLVFMLLMLAAFFPYYVREWWEIFPTPEFGKYWLITFAAAAVVFALICRGSLVKPEFWWIRPVTNNREKLLRFVAFIAVGFSFLLIIINI